MNNPRYDEKTGRNTDIALGLVIALTSCCAVVTGFLSYSFNNKLATSIIVGFTVVAQSMITWWFSGRKKSKETV